MYHLAAKIRFLLKHRIRWVICSLLLLATVINYLDRTALGILAPNLQQQFHWNEKQYGMVLLAFQVTYTVMNLPWGAIMDRLGVRRGFTVAIVLWSLASMGHAFARNVFDFGFWRALLGIGEAGNFPGAVKAIAQWFPQRERGTAAGFLNAGANVGTMIGGAVITLLLIKTGWRGAFIFTGVAGLLFAVLWWSAYRAPEDHPRLTPEERAVITSDGPHGDVVRRVPWRQLIGERRAWAFILGKTFSDPVWGFFLFWMPKFLHDVYHMSAGDRGLALVLSYLAADFGSIGGGWLSGYFIGRGWSVNRARKTTMAMAAFTIPLVGLAGFCPNGWLAVALISIALAGHQWWSSNLFTTVSDMFPTQAVGTVVGMGQVGGSSSGILINPLIGWWLDRTNHNYRIIFVIASLAYPIAFICLHALAPKLDRAPLRLDEASAT